MPKKWILFFLLLYMGIASVGYAQLAVMPESRFRMGVYYPSIKNLVSRVDFEVAINFWLQEISYSVNFKSTNAKLFDSISGMREAFDKGELDFVLAPPLLLAKYFNRDSLADGFVGTTLDGKSYGTVLLVRGDKRINDLKDLTGKRLLMPERDELAAVFLDTLIIKSHRRHYQQVFSSVQNREKQSAIILDVFFNQADACVVFEETYNLMVELNPQIKDVMKILATFPTKSPNYGFFSREYPKSIRDRVTETVAILNKEVRSQQILTDLRMSSLIKCPIEELLPFDKLIQEHQSLQKGIKK